MSASGCSTGRSSPVPDRAAVGGCGRRCRWTARRDDPRRARRRPGDGARRVPHDPGERARSRRRRRGRRRARRRRPRRPRPARRGADGRAHAPRRRDRGDPADPRGRRSAAGADADDVRSRRLRLRRAACRGQRLPVEGCAGRAARRRGAGDRPRRRAARPVGHPSADRGGRPPAGVDATAVPGLDDLTDRERRCCS